MDTKRFLLHVLLGAGAGFLIFLTSVQLSLLGMVIRVFAPLPVMVLYHRWGLAGAGLTTLIGTLGVSALLNPLLGINFFTEFGLLGILLYRYIVIKRLDWDRGVLFASVGFATILGLLLALYWTATSFDFVDWMRQEILDTGRAWLQPQGLDGGAEEAARTALEKVTEILLHVSPALMMLTVWLEGIISVAVFRRLTGLSVFGGHQIPLKPEFRNWFCHDRLVWVGILGAILIIIKTPFLSTLGLNIVILMVAVYLLQGLAVVCFLFDRKNVPLGFRIMGYVLIGLIQFLAVLVTALGLFDIWLDFRKLRPKVAAYRRTL
jgi:uncharacterized protein YybS (DUF2232 family)